MKNIPTIGQMRDRIKIETRTIVISASGEAETWTTIATLWGKIVNLSTSKKIYLGSYFDNVTHDIYFRNYLSYNIEDTRFTFGDKVYHPVTPPELTDTGKSKFTKYIVKEDIS